MTCVKTRPSFSGFWFLISTPQREKYTFEFFIIGHIGQQRAGAIRGITHVTPMWRFYKTNAPVIKVGITSLESKLTGR
jgi:hypothetical protein